MREGGIPLVASEMGSSAGRNYADPCSLSSSDLCLASVMLRPFFGSIQLERHADAVPACEFAATVRKQALTPWRGGNRCPGFGAVAGGRDYQAQVAGGALPGPHPREAMLLSAFPSPIAVRKLRG